MWQRIVYKFRYFKRCFWRGINRCEKCHEELEYTPSGRGICMNGDCK